MGSDGLSQVSPACCACPHHLPRELLGPEPLLSQKDLGGLTGSAVIFHNSQKTGIQEARKEEDGELTAQMTGVQGQIRSGDQLLESPRAVRLMVATKPEPVSAGSLYPLLHREINMST